MQSTPVSWTAYSISRALAKQSGRTGGVMEMLRGLEEIMEKEVEKFLEFSTSFAG